MSKIVNGVYIGNWRDANNRIFLTTNKITHVLCSASELRPVYTNDYQYLHCKAQDTFVFDITQHFHEAADFIHQAVSNKGKVLVHCYAGVSRSSSFVLAYLIKHQNMKLKEALTLCRQKRKIVNPNPNFISHLKRWEAAHSEPRPESEMAASHIHKTGEIRLQDESRENIKKVKQSELSPVKHLQHLKFAQRKLASGLSSSKQNNVHQFKQMIEREIPKVKLRSSDYHSSLKQSLALKDAGKSSFLLKKPERGIEWTNRSSSFKRSLIYPRPLLTDSVNLNIKGGEEIRKPVLLSKMQMSSRIDDDKKRQFNYSSQHFLKKKTSSTRETGKQSTLSDWRVSFDQRYKSQLKGEKLELSVHLKRSAKYC